MTTTRGRIRIVGLTLVLIVLAGCGGSTADKAGGASGRQPRILTMASPTGQSASQTMRPGSSVGFMGASSQALRASSIVAAPGQG